MMIFPQSKTANLGIVLSLLNLCPWIVLWFCVFVLLLLFRSFMSPQTTHGMSDPEAEHVASCQPDAAPASSTVWSALEISNLSVAAPSSDSSGGGGCEDV